MLKLYGVLHSRAFRCLWMLEELGLDYELVRTDFLTGDHRQPDYLALNPNAHIPTLQDGDLVLWESLAINLYLAERHGAESGLWPQAVADHGRCYQWSLWAANEIETPLLQTLLHRGHVGSVPPERRRPERADKAEQELQRPLGALEQALAEREHLLGEAFSVADLNVASVMSWGQRSGVQLDAFGNVARWLPQCLARPAVKQAVQRGKAA